MEHRDHDLRRPSSQYIEVSPKAPTTCRHHIDAKQQVAAGMHEHAGTEGFGAYGEPVHERAPDEGTEVILRLVHERDGQGDNPKRSPGVLPEGHSEKRAPLGLHVAHEEAAPEEFLDEGDDDYHAEEAQCHRDEPSG